MITIRHLNKQFGANRVLRDVSLDFARGRVYGIVGENGAGKTTLFKCIAGLEPHDGDIACELHPLKDKLGYLPTDPFFFARMTGREYLELVTRARGVVLTDLDRPNIFDLPLDQYASTYSTGMKKKLALTGILLQPNEVFILDEPSNGVDIHSNIMITEIVRQLRDRGKTVIISSHIFATLADTCDEIFLLQDGHITRHVDRADFAALEREMRDFTVGDRLGRVGL